MGLPCGWHESVHLGYYPWSNLGCCWIYSIVLFISVFEIHIFFFFFFFSWNCVHVFLYCCLLWMWVVGELLIGLPPSYPPELVFALHFQKIVTDFQTLGLLHVLEMCLGLTKGTCFLWNTFPKTTIVTEVRTMGQLHVLEMCFGLTKGTCFLWNTFAMTTIVTKVRTLGLLHVLEMCLGLTTGTWFMWNTFPKTVPLFYVGWYLGRSWDCHKVEVSQATCSFLGYYRIHKHWLMSVCYIALTRYLGGYFPSLVNQALIMRWTCCLQ